MGSAIKIVGIGGTARQDSSSERVVRCALAAAAAQGAEIELFDGPFLASLPLYIPDRTERTTDERRFVAAVRGCDGIIVGSPGYHGSLSGPIKNVLDLLEDLARDERPYLEGRAFGSIVTAYGWQACGTTLVAMRSIAHALRAWPTPFGAAVNASVPVFDEKGDCLDAKTAEQLAIVGRQVTEFAHWRRAGLAA
ncbi:NADPH-dependent oxidoreductase [Sphingomonas populi]|uniref:NADPH-dependent oxidoreductase n=1 Tax=Sphingomonas populi TaxID=2484750 RepID=A0A4Q6Y5M0_9SPHN|nr:NAD(P)H-dependent oxidoreductase [Sphingomonas populi]RZF64749.1 NADPH-dependent oxidoreductase [Sphingomonas populi]